MRCTMIASALLLGSVALAGCNDSPLAVEQSSLSGSVPSLAVRTGESYASIRITNPSSQRFTISPGSTFQMAGILEFSAGGTLPSVPYAQWRSSDNCVADVTSGYPSWGLVKGLKSGTAMIIAEAWGRADTVEVTVSGTDYPSEKCYDAEWKWDYKDVSFTGSPAHTYSVAPGEALKSVVLFAGPGSEYTVKSGESATLVSELWYSKGGRWNARGFATFSVTDGAVATINRRGVVTGLKAGKTKVIARLGAMSDTVPLYVR